MTHGYVAITLCCFAPPRLPNSSPSALQPRRLDRATVHWPKRDGHRVAAHHGSNDGLDGGGWRDRVARGGDASMGDDPNASEGCTRSPGKTTSVVRRDSRHRAQVARPVRAGRRQTCTRAASGEEAGMIESMGQFIGVGLGVVGLSFIAGAQSNGETTTRPPTRRPLRPLGRLPPATTNPRCPSRPSRAASRAPTTGKSSSPACPSPRRRRRVRFGRRPIIIFVIVERGGGALGGAPAIKEHRRRQHDEGAHGRRGRFVRR